MTERKTKQPIPIVSVEYSESDFGRKCRILKTEGINRTDLVVGTNRLTHPETQERKVLQQLELGWLSGLSIQDAVEETKKWAIALHDRDTSEEWDATWTLYEYEEDKSGRELLSEGVSETYESLMDMYRTAYPGKIAITCSRTQSGYGLDWEYRVTLKIDPSGKASVAYSSNSSDKQPFLDIFDRLSPGDDASQDLVGNMFDQLLGVKPEREENSEVASSN